ncbi:MAG: hypothetical protein AB8B95_14850 [Pseudohongiellaceae bacterium]
MSSELLVFTIIFCEIAFWVFLVAGLASRYILKWEKLSRILLYSIPLIDLVLLGATVIDLRAGSVATFAHGLAAAYLGFTLSFGKMTINWADRAFARRFANGPAEAEAPSHGLPLLKREMKLFGRCVMGCAITVSLAYLAILLVNDQTKTEELEVWLQLPFSTAFLWFIFGPLWGLLFSWKPRASKD